MDYSDSSKFIVSALLNSAHFVAVGFFRDVKNAAVVREKLVNGTLEAAVIDCRLVRCDKLCSIHLHFAHVYLTEFANTSC